MHQIPPKLHRWVPQTVPNICNGNAHKKTNPNFTPAEAILFRCLYEELSRSKQRHKQNNIIKAINSGSLF